MVMRSRNRLWIIRSQVIAKKIINNCVDCHYRKNLLQGQKMAPLPNQRIGPSPIFDSVAVDLFGPLEYKDMVKKRVTGKEWHGDLCYSH